MALEDDALDRLYSRLEMALWQVEMNDPDIEWRSTYGRA